MLVLINLDSAHERRAAMFARLQPLDLSAERVGFDGRTLSAAALSEFLARTFPQLAFDRNALSGAEIGCWVSHLLAWRRLQQSAARACTVIEDDVHLASHFAHATAALAQQDQFDVIYLGTSSRNLSTRRRSVIDGFSVHEPIGAVFNTWGYVISREFVERFFAMKRLRLRLPIDHVLGGRVRQLKPRIAVLRPPAVWEDAALGRISQIEPFTFRLDRARVVESARRRILASRLSDWYYALYKYL